MSSFITEEVTQIPPSNPAQDAVLTQILAQLEHLTIANQVLQAKVRL